MVVPSSQLTLPDSLSVLWLRLTLRLLEDAPLPAYKGGLLRGGFGYGFQRSCCPRPCWGHVETCAADMLCAYRWIFETPHPTHIQHLHDLRDVPRPFVIEPPLDGRTQYAAGDALEFGLVLIGRAIDYLPYFLFSFEQLGLMGLGRQHARARLERVEALPAWQAVGEVIYQDGRASIAERTLPLITANDIHARAASLPSDVRMVLRTPLRVKTSGDWLRQIEPAAIVQAIGWRVKALATFHGSGPWEADQRAVVDQARAIRVEDARVQWVDWERTSTRYPESRKMTLGGIVGSAVLRNVSPDVRAVLLMGSVVHVGKAGVFGHGQYVLEPV